VVFRAGVRARDFLVRISPAPQGLEFVMTD
jgi:hypothetical protein